MYWSSIVRNRRRFESGESGKLDLAKQCAEFLNRNCLPTALPGDSFTRDPETGLDNRIKYLAEAHVIEVSIPFESEGKDWEGRVFPWEYVLGTATMPSRRRRGIPLTVYRHLAKTGKPLDKPKIAPRKAVLLQNSPGNLREQYDFDFESNLLKNRLGLPENAVKPLVDLDSETIKKKIKSIIPDIIHISGFDSHQASELLDDDTEDRENQKNNENEMDRFLDGLAVTGKDHGPEFVPSERLAPILNAGSRKPMLVTFNIYNSAARTAALTVAAGARAAIGIYDVIDDPTAEAFYARFFSALRHCKGNAHAAFQLAIDEIRSGWGGLSGAGIVWWSDYPFFPPNIKKEDAWREFTKARDRVEQVLEDSRKKPITKYQIRNRVKPPVEVEFKPEERISYCMLHSGVNIFEKFSLAVRNDGQLNHVSVTVELDAGSQKPSYRSTIGSIAAIKDLRDEVALPLVSDLLRSIGQETKTTLYYKVEVEDKGTTTILSQDTRKITLAPVDEWRLDDSDVQWLPAFVQPFDPAVLKIIDSAQKYLCALLDDAGAGFDGYQSVEEDGEDNETYSSVDAQVQAIWSTLCQDHRLYYINPPPSFDENSQRLRRPSQVLEGRRGTCIDLAMLLASCLEFVEIYPVIFLLDDHAFPGYWRSEKAREKFITGPGAPDGDQTTEPDVDRTAEPGEDQTIEPNGGEPARDVSGQSSPWVFGSAGGGFERIAKQVYDGSLVALESVDLTVQGPFWQAMENGERHLDGKKHFHSLIELVQARRGNVTPLPILELKK